MFPWKKVDDNMIHKYIFPNILQQYLLIELLKDVFDGVKLHFPGFCTGHQIAPSHYNCMKQFSVGLISRWDVKTNTTAKWTTSSVLYFLHELTNMYRQYIKRTV